MGKGRLQILLLLCDKLLFSRNYYPYAHFYENMVGYSPGSIRVLLNRLIGTGQIEKIIRNGKANFCLTSRGIKDVKKIFALERNNPKWDGKWRLLLIKNRPHKISKFAFRRLQTDVYISPFAHNEVELFVHGYTVETKNISPLDNRKLSNIIWPLDRLNKEYATWLTNTQQITRGSIGEIIFQYEAIIKQDPFLPLELLPKEWRFEKARERLVWLVKRYFSNRKM